jgi:WD40 repeat protein
MRLLAAFLALLPATPVAADQEAKPDLDRLAKTASQSIEKLRGGAASWTAAHTLDSGARMLVQAIQSGRKQRFIFSVENGGQTIELARLIIRDGFWYASDQGGAGKFRPFEATFQVPSLYLFLTRSDVLFLTKPKVLEGVPYEGLKDGVATWRSEAPALARQQLEAMIQKVEAIRKSDPARFEASGLGKRMQESRDLLDKGFPFAVEVKSGLVVLQGSAKLMSRIENFRWLDRADEREFAVEGKTWADHTGDPTLGERGDLALIGHNGVWQPGAKTGDLELCLVNVKTGAYRRVPYEGSIALPGCFSSDRSRVYVTGQTQDGVLGLFEVDLKSGVNRPLGGNLENPGNLMFPALSPDGKTLVALNTGGGSGFLQSQVVLVDVASGRAKNLGKPLDTAFLSWGPEGKGIVLVSRRLKGLDQPTEDSIARLDLEGTLTVLRRGGNPLVLDSAGTILFNDEDGSWKTCDVDGKNDKPFGDVLARHGFPAVAPDGKRVLMLRFKPGVAPEPVVLSIGSFEAKPIPVSGGIWTLPAWR